MRRLARGTDEQLYAECRAEKRQLLLRLVRQAWDTELTDCQRSYLLCYSQDAMTMRQIAETFGVTVPTVSRTLKRARARLRKVLQYYLRNA